MDVCPGLDEFPIEASFAMLHKLRFLLSDIDFNSTSNKYRSVYNNGQFHANKNGCTKQTGFIIISSFRPKNCNHLSLSAVVRECRTAALRAPDVARKWALMAAAPEATPLPVSAAQIIT